MGTLLRSVLTLIAAPVLVVFAAAGSHSGELAPFKDELFAYPAVLSQADDGTYVVIDYREARDINARDEIPERRAKGSYVALGVRRAQQDLVLATPVGNIGHFAVGRAEDAKFITVYLHGYGGSRSQGVDDFTFGGNFNRIKNLMVENGGLYLSPDFSNFDDGGAAEVSALISHYLEKSPAAKLFVACGSRGGALCWKLAADKAIAQRLSGFLLLGSYWDDEFLGSAAFREKVPVFFGLGSKDKVFPVEGQEAFFRSIREGSPAYPVHFVRFETGTHGTPIRMVDWRHTLNWMLSVK